MGKRYPHVGSDEWVYPVMEGYRMMCCDCGLVHELDFEVVDAEYVRFRARRNNRSTANARRSKRLTAITPKP